MREEILINLDWCVLVNPPPKNVVKTKPGMYLSAKTERLKWGPGAYHHSDVPEKWDFENELPAEPWQHCDLPHDYIISQTPCPDETGALGYFKYFPAWYRKHLIFTEADRGKRLAVYFEGITGISDIYLNGCFLKHNDGGYVSFEVDITDLVRFDQENVLAIHIDPNSYETWWYAGGGIYRNVRLVKTDPVAVDLWGVFVPVRKLDATCWEVPAEVTLRNISYFCADVEADCAIIDPDGREVGVIRLTGTVPARGTATLTGTTRVVKPAIWDIDTPNLYTLRVSVKKTAAGSQGVPCDEYRQRFGFREIAFTPNEGFFLNGRNLKIKGVCAHSDFGLTGKAVPDNICRYRIGLFKKMGANALRTSHYPHNEAEMNACDELGMLVMDETRRFETNPEAVAQLEMMVKRDRNRPSVFLWSTGNEEMVYYGIEPGHRIHKALEFAVRKLDPTRPITTAVNEMSRTTIQSDLEIIGGNYSLDCFDRIHREFPDKPFISSENCAVGSTRGWFIGDSPERGRLDARDRDTDMASQAYGRENTWKFIMERPWLAGGFQWDAVEHRGEAVWPRLCSVSGAFDLFLQKKDAYYQNQSHWLDTPMIHVLPHWNHPGMEGREIKVWVYTNCEEAELFLNGKSLGRQSVPKWTHVEWSVPYHPGKLEAVGFNRGKTAATDVQETTGSAVSLKLIFENGPVAANGDDVAFFTCVALDTQGREVPDAAVVVHFDCIGLGRLVGTGSDNTDHVPVTAIDRRMYAGRIGIAIRTGVAAPESTREKLTLFARAEGLASTCLDVEMTR